MFTYTYFGTILLSPFYKNKKQAVMCASQKPAKCFRIPNSETDSDHITSQSFGWVTCEILVNETGTLQELST